ncbi:MAG: IPT/TIG domain-containing protein [Silvibacterium sp.]
MTSVQPTAFFAGETTSITINGSNFIAPGNANNCPQTQLSVTAGSDDVEVSSLNIVSSSQMTATVVPLATDPPGTASISVANTNLNGGWLPATTTASVLPVPAIQWNNNTISGANPPTQSAVIGQQINLTIDPTTLPTGIAVTQNTWTVGGTNIGAYAATNTSSTITPTDLTQSSLNTYWVYASTKGNSLGVTYQYCVNIPGFGNACSPNATAKFNISGGGKMSSNAYNKLTIDTLTPCGGGSAGPFLVYGNITGTSCVANPGGTWGISFKPSGAPSGGTYSYVQLINSDTRTLTATNTITCTHDQGIDGGYPYSGIIPNTNPPQALDAPGDPLQNGYTATRSFNATMFLMWTSNVANSIPVPIGYQTWDFSGSAQQNSSGKWTATTSGTPGVVGSFISSSGTQPNNGYPAWTMVSTETCNP